MKEPVRLRTGGCGAGERMELLADCNGGSMELKSIVCLRGSAEVLV